MINPVDYNVKRQELKNKDDFLFWYYNRHGGILRKKYSFINIFDKWCILKNGTTASVAKIRIIQHLDKKYLRN